MKITALEAINKIQASADARAALGTQVRTLNMKIEEVVRHGDLYIERVQMLEGRGELIASRQLAPGTTKGSRHIVASDASIFKTNPTLNGKARFQVGCGIEVVDELLIQHPEHDWIHIKCDEPSCFQVYFQADFARKERALD